MIRRRRAAFVRARGSRSARSPLERLGAAVARLPWVRAQGDVLLGRATVLGAGGALVIGSSAQGWRAAAAAPLGAWLGWRLGPAMDARARFNAAAAAARALPDLLDRMSICVNAGMSIERTLRTVTPRVSGPVGDALREGLRALDAGVPRRAAYERIADASGVEQVRDLMNALARAEMFGTPLADALAAHAQDLRARARAAAETEARTAPVKLIFPLVFCFLPAFVLLTVAPIAISAVRTIGGV